MSAAKHLSVFLAPDICIPVTSFEFLFGSAGLSEARHVKLIVRVQSVRHLPKVDFDGG